MPDDPYRHAETWSLLPWLANGRATPEERSRAEAHLAVCAECREELAREHDLARAFAEPPVAQPDAERGLERLLERLDRADDGLAPVPVPARQHRWTVALAVAGVLQLALLGLLGTMATGLRSPDVATYHTLTSPDARPADGPRWRVVFDPQLKLVDLQTLLQQQGLAVDTGPSEAGVFTLAPTAPVADADARAAALRALPQVRFAEAVVPAASR